MLPGYYTPEGRLLYAGRADTGLPDAELERLWQRLQPLLIDKMPLAEPPPRGTRFGSSLVLSRVHWVGLLAYRPQMRCRDRLAAGGKWISNHRFRAK